jgi:hypothetical protein
MTNHREGIPRRNFLKTVAGGALALVTGAGLYKVVELEKSETNQVATNLFKYRDILQEFLPNKRIPQSVEDFENLLSQLHSDLRTYGTFQTTKVEQIGKDFYSAYNGIKKVSNLGDIEQSIKIRDSILWLSKVINSIDALKEVKPILEKIFENSEGLLKKLRQGIKGEISKEEVKAKVGQELNRMKILLKSFNHITDNDLRSFISELLMAQINDNPMYIHPAVAILAGIPKNHVWREFSSLTEAKLAIMHFSEDLVKLIQE